MSWTLWWKFLGVSLLLRLAAAWAGLFRARLRGTSLGRGDYTQTAASQRFGFQGPFDYDTVLELPRAERYPWRIGVPKALVVAALSVPMPEARGRRLRSLSEVDGLYVLLGRPRLRSLPYDSDEVFARLRLQGPNPLWIRREGPGYAVDYRALLAGLPPQPGRWLAPCVARFDAVMAPTEIELEVEGRPERFSPGDGLHWTLAKRFFQAADLFVHEAVSHLAWTHLHAEAVILDAARTLSAGHPLRRLLGPSFGFTLQANSNSGRVLLGRGGVFDRVCSAGWEGTAIVMARAEKLWRFSRMIPALDAQERGMDELEDYPWRDDATLLWEVVHDRARQAVAALPWDPELVAFLAALHARFGDRGWPSAQDQDHHTLATVTAALQFLTVRHTLVNAQQYDMFGYPPAWPTTVAVPPPRRDQALEPDVLTEALPDLGQILDTLRATYAFSIQFNRLGAGDPALQRALQAVDRELARRDRARPWPYQVARPARVSGSINA
jgi:hypothetical protein